jgi:hypothetical protein
MSQTKTLKITPTCFDPMFHCVEMKHAKRMNVCCRIITLEDSNFNQ